MNCSNGIPNLEKKKFNFWLKRLWLWVPLAAYTISKILCDIRTGQIICCGVSGCSGQLHYLHRILFLVFKWGIECCIVSALLTQLGCVNRPSQEKQMRGGSWLCGYGKFCFIDDRLCVASSYKARGALVDSCICQKDMVTFEHDDPWNSETFQ
jgi:hypothetical protein